MSREVTNEEEDPLLCLWEEDRRRAVPRVQAGLLPALLRARGGVLLRREGRPGVTETAFSHLFRRFDNLPWLEERCILLVKAGSYAYGTNTKDSDLDFRGIVIPPKEYVLGFVNNFEQAESIRDGWDVAFHELRKFFRLASGGNIQFLEMLYGLESNVVHDSVAGRILRGSRRTFLSKNVAKAVRGFAWAQLMRLEAQYNRTARDEGHGLINGKMAMHAIRLMRMGVELFKDPDKGLQVWRTDAQDLLDVRHGWEFAEVFAEAKRLMGELDDLVERSELPQEPNRRELDDLCQGLMKNRL
jgi:uncharacterized protein